VRPWEVAMATTLSTDELQVLQYLPTRMSFGEIGEQLLAPRDNVKWQAIAVYRKLGVVTRAEAIQRAQTMGLLSSPVD
jgi:LuxR family maltose regulon positive regulatory protein